MKRGAVVPDTEQGVTIGLREIYDLAKESAEGVRSINQRLDKMEETESVSHEAHQKATAALERIKTIETHLTWLWRTIVGAALMSGIALAFTHINFK